VNISFQQTPIEQKREMFAVRNRMIDSENHFPKKDTLAICECGVKEDMRHIYNSELLSDNNIFNGNLEQQTVVYKIFKHNLEKREQMKNHPHVIHQRSAVTSNG
jgi:hypothetical protein